MLARRLVVAIGIVTMFIGLLQIIIPKKMEALVRSYMTGGSIYALAIVSLVFGIVFIWAGGTRKVRLFRLILILGFMVVVSGIFLAITPGIARDLAYSFYFDKPGAYKRTAGLLGGLIRIILGAVIIYAGLQPPAPRTPRLGSIVPLA